MSTQDRKPYEGMLFLVMAYKENKVDVQYLLQYVNDTLNAINSYNDEWSTHMWRAWDDVEIPVATVLAGICESIKPEHVEFMEQGIINMESLLREKLNNIDLQSQNIQQDL
jgi:hypothetical protein